MHLCPVEPFFLHFDSRSVLIWNQSEEKRVQLGRCASFRGDFLKNPYFNNKTQILMILLSISLDKLPCKNQRIPSYIW